MRRSKRVVKSRNLARLLFCSFQFSRLDNTCGTREIRRESSFVHHELNKIFLKFVMFFAEGRGTLGIRWFIVQDVELIEEDLEQLRLLFLAEGDGLPLDQVTEACAPLASILTVMQLETGILISNYQQVGLTPRKHSTGHGLPCTSWPRTFLARPCGSGSFPKKKR